MVVVGCCRREIPSSPNMRLTKEVSNAVKIIHVRRMEEVTRKKPTASQTPMLHLRIKAVTDVLR